MGDGKKIDLMALPEWLRDLYHPGWQRPDTPQDTDVDVEVEANDAQDDYARPSSALDSHSRQTFFGNPFFGPSPTRGMSTEQRIRFWQDSLIHTLTGNSNASILESLRSMSLFTAKISNPVGLYFLGRELKSAIENPEKRQEFYENLRDGLQDSLISGLVVFGAIVGPGKTSEPAEVKAGGETYQVGVKDGSIVVNGFKWKVQGTSWKIRAGADIKFTSASLVPGVGLKIGVVVSVPDALMGMVPDNLKDKVNNPNHPIEETISESDLEPLLKELSTDKDSASIPQLKDYPIEVVRG